MRYRYYSDLYSNQYRWSTEKSVDGWFNAQILKFKISNGWGKHIISKERNFRKRKDAKAWCWNNYIKATEHQRIVLGSRADRKAEREALKPVFTKLEIKMAKSKKEVERLRANIKRANTKIKGLSTRKNTYEKKIKKNLRDIEKMLVVQ